LFGVLPLGTKLPLIGYLWVLCGLIACVWSLVEVLSFLFTYHAYKLLNEFMAMVVCQRVVTL